MRKLLILDKDLIQLVTASWLVGPNEGMMMLDLGERFNLTDRQAQYARRTYRAMNRREVYFTKNRLIS